MSKTKKQTNSEGDETEELITLIGDIQSVEWGDFRPMSKEELEHFNKNKDEWSYDLGDYAYQLILSYEGENGESNS